jgi:HlyD family secretion protein
MRSRFGGPISLALAVTVLAGLYFAYNHLFHQAPLPEGLIQANGRIEGDHITVSSKFSGRIQSLPVHEGDVVKSGQVLIVLDDTQARIRATQAEKAVATLRARVEALQMDLEVMRKEVPLAIDAAKAEVAHGTAIAAKAEATEQQARRDALRQQQLVSQGAASRQREEQAELALTAAHDDLSASRTAVTRAQKQLAQVELGWERINVKEGELKAVRAQLEQSEANLAEAESILSDLVIKAPSDGVILTHIADVGEMAVPGTPLLDLVDLDHLYLKVYVPEVEIGKLRLGLPARIRTDCFPDRDIPAAVRMISARAEFTPKEVQTHDERTKLVYAVKLYLDENPDHSLTPGMPADAIIRWKEDVEWAAPRW